MKIVSLVFHPLLIATHLSIFFLFQAPELLPRIQPEVAKQFLLVVFIITAVMPAFSVFLLRTFRYISDLELINRNERAIPFLFIFFYYAIASYLFYEKLDIGLVFNTIMISATVLIFIVLIVTLKFKISIHATAIWSAVGFVTAILMMDLVRPTFAYYPLLVAAGLTATSRLYLGFHTPREVWTGILLGFIYSFSLIRILL